MTTVEEIQSTIADLVGVEPKSLGSDREAKEAASWVAVQKQVEADTAELLDPAIKEAYAAHKELTGQKKTLLESLEAAKNRVRFHLANWIAAGHAVVGCYTKTTYKVTVNDPAMVPDDYAYRAIDEKKLADWAKLTEGKQGVPGCTIEPCHVLYATEKP